MKAGDILEENVKHGEYSYNIVLTSDLPVEVSVEHDGKPVRCVRFSEEDFINSIFKEPINSNEAVKVADDNFKPQKELDPICIDMIEKAKEILMNDINNGVVDECLDNTALNNQKNNQSQNCIIFFNKNNNEQSITAAEFAKEFDKIKDGNYGELHKRLDDDFYQKKNMLLSDYIIFKVTLYFRENNTAKALELLERYKYDLKDRYHALRAKIYIEEKKYKEGIDYIEDWLKKNSSESTEYTKLLGYKLVCSYYLGYYNDVISSYEKEVNKSGDFCLQFLYRHLYLLSCIMAGDDENRNKALNDIKLLTDDTERKFSCRDYWFIRAYNKEDKTFDVSKLNECFKNVSKYEFFYFIIRYSASLGYISDVFLKQEILSNLVKTDKFMSSVSKNPLSDCYNRIWFWTQTIIMMLMIKDDDKINRFSHYVSRSDFMKLMNGEYSIAKMPISETNDNKEGEVLSDIFKNNNVNCDMDYIDNNYIAIQTSFTCQEDNKEMFERYGKGKDEEKGGTGFSLVFNKTFFNTNMAAIRDYSDLLLTSSISMKEKQRNLSLSFEEERDPLFWILYYDETKNRLFYYPDGDEINIYLKEDPECWNQYKNDKKKQIENRLLYSFRNLFDIVKELKTDEEKKIATRILYQLRYCIKTSGCIEQLYFPDEKECRILDVCDVPDNKQEKGKGTIHKDYMKINDGRNFLEKIIIGPRVKDVEDVKKNINKNMKGSKVEVTVSNAPLD